MGNPIPNPMAGDASYLCDGFFSTKELYRDLAINKHKYKK